MIQVSKIQRRRNTKHHLWFCETVQPLTSCLWTMDCSLCPGMYLERSASSSVLCPTSTLWRTAWRYKLSCRALRSWWTTINGQRMRKPGNFRGWLYLDSNRPFFAVVLDLNGCDCHDAVTELPAVRVAMMRMPAGGQSKVWENWLQDQDQLQDYPNILMLAQIVLILLPLWENWLQDQDQV